MRLALFLLVGALASGCAHPLQRIQVDEPANAEVVIEGGPAAQDIKTRAPFVGSFEAVSLKDWAAYHLTLTLAAKDAARFGARESVTLYGKLVVGPPTELSRTLTVTLAMPEEKIRALVAGTRVEIETFVEDPNGTPPTELARLTLRTSPF